MPSESTTTTETGLPSGVCPIRGEAPHPKTLGARVYRRSHSKSLSTVQDHPVEQIAFAGSIHAGDRDDADGALDGREDALRLFSNNEFYTG